MLGPCRWHIECLMIARTSSLSFLKNPVSPCHHILIRLVNIRWAGFGRRRAETNKLAILSTRLLRTHTSRVSLLDGHLPQYIFFVCVCFKHSTHTVIVCQNFSTHLVTADKELTINQISPKSSWLTSKFYFIGVTCRITNEGWLTLAEMIQRQLHSQRPFQHGCQFTEVGTLEHTAQPVGSLTGWWVTLPSDSVALNIFQASWLLSASSRRLVWS